MAAAAVRTQAVLGGVEAVAHSLPGARGAGQGEAGDCLGGTLLRGILCSQLGVGRGEVQTGERILRGMGRRGNQSLGVHLGAVHNQMVVGQEGVRSQGVHKLAGTQESILLQGVH